MSSQPLSFSSALNGNNRRNSPFFPKSAAPSSFSASFSRVVQSKTVDDTLLLPLECAFYLPYHDSISQDKYFVTVGEKVGFQNIIYGGKNGLRMVMHLASQRIVDDFVTKNDSILIDDQLLPVRKLIDPGLVLYLHNTVPHLPNAVIEEELKKHVHLLSEIKLSNYGMKDPRLRHVLAYKRQVQIPSEEKNKVPMQITVTWKNISYSIPLLFDGPRCYNCGKEGHISKNCSEITNTPAQKRLGDIMYTSSSPMAAEVSLSTTVDPGTPANPATHPAAPNAIESKASVSEENTSAACPPEDIHRGEDKLETMSHSSSISSSSIGDEPRTIEQDLIPKFAIRRSSSSPLIGEDKKTDFPSLPGPPSVLNQDNKMKLTKRNLSPADNTTEKKIKIGSSTVDPEMTEGFKCLVQTILVENQENAFTSEDFCSLMASLRNSQKKQEILLESGLPLENVRKVLSSILASSDVKPNIKSRISRLLRCNVFEQMET